MYHASISHIEEEEEMAELMVVDDEAVISMQLKERLKSMGHNVVGCAYTGKESITMAKRLKPDLILMDIVMPGKIDGIDAAKMIKKELDIPIIFITAWADDKFVERAKFVEPFGYIVKPFNESELRAMIEVALYKKGIERDLSESEELFRSIVDNLYDTIISININKEINFCNSAIEKMFGCSAGEVIGKPLTLLISECLKKDLEKEIDGLLLSKQERVYRKSKDIIGLRKDGSEFPMELTLITCKIWSEKLLIGIMRDLSRLKILERIQNDETIHKGMLPICSYCKKIRDENDNWIQLEKYLLDNYNILFTHSICSECIRKYYPDISD